MSEADGEGASVAPAPLKVRILDLSGGAEDNIVEDVGGFLTVEHANAFARAYVIDSLERCRVADMTADDVLQSWFAFGEDAEVLEAVPGEGWRSAAELNVLAAAPATAEERDWRSIDPRRHDFVDAPDLDTDDSDATE